MNLFVLLAICIAATAVELQGASVGSRRVSNLFLGIPGAHRLQRRQEEPQVEEQQSYEWRPSACQLAEGECMRHIHSFGRAVSDAYNGDAPFSTNAEQVDEFCTDVASVRACLESVGVCEDSYLPREEIIASLDRVCSNAGRAALEAMDGLSCNADIDMETFYRQCMNEGQSNSPENFNEDDSSWSDCQQFACEQRATVERCGETVAHFYNEYLRPSQGMEGCV